MKALLRKEVHDLRAWVFIGGALVISLRLLCFSREFEVDLWGLYWYLLMPLMATVAGVGMGASQVAGERHAKTLDYLLVRPVATHTIVWAKFLAGTMALLFLVGALVWLGYGDSQYHDDTFTSLIRENVDPWRLAAILFSRVWCVYAFALFFSALVDRAAKVAAAMAACVIALHGLTSAYSDSTPRAYVEFWLPFVEFGGGLVRVTRDPTLLWITSISLCGVALATAFGVAAFLKRSSDRHLGNWPLTLGAAGLIGVTILAGRVSGLSLFRQASASFLEFKTGSDEESNYYQMDMAASRGLVCLGVNDRLIFLDFSDPADPRKMAEVRIPLWTTFHVSLVGTEAYVVGKRKALPVDEIQIIVLNLVRQDSVQISAPIVLDRVDPTFPNGQFVLPVVPLGRFVFASSGCSLNQPQCRLQVFDLSTKRETTALPMDTFRFNPRRPKMIGMLPGAVAMCLNGAHLYVSSPSTLTTLDVRNPAQPIVTSRIALWDFSEALYGLPRQLFTQGERLYEVSLVPDYLRTYDLSDPSRPVRASDFNWHVGEQANWSLNLVTSGQAFYEIWQSKIVGFHPIHRGFELPHYLDNGRSGRYRVNRLASAGGYVYAASYDTASKTARVDAFRVRE